MIVKLRKTGNSVMVFLPKAILEQCPVKDYVRLEVIGNTIIIRSLKTKPRQGWEEQFLKAGSLEDNRRFMDELDGTFDEEDK